jgi:HK97 gp10 family phage protein
MAEISIEITNLPEIRAAFRKAPAMMVRELDKAIRKSIFAIKGDSQRRSPVDTGYMRASHREMFSSLRGEVGPQAYYSIFVHDGTSRMRARPFLYDAVKSDESQVQGFFEDAVQNTLDQIGKDVG